MARSHVSECLLVTAGMIPSPALGQYLPFQTLNGREHSRPVLARRQPSRQSRRHRPLHHAYALPEVRCNVFAKIIQMSRGIGLQDLPATRSDCFGHHSVALNEWWPSGSYLFDNVRRGLSRSIVAGTTPRWAANSTLTAIPLLYSTRQRKNDRLHVPDGVSSSGASSRRR
jgi:hypothetical protein